MEYLFVKSKITCGRHKKYHMFCKTPRASIFFNKEKRRGRGFDMEERVMLNLAYDHIEKYVRDLESRCLCGVYFCLQLLNKFSLKS